MVAAVLVADGLAHLFWASGLTWPAPDTRSLSEAVLGADIPFTSQVLLPLAVVLFGAAGLVIGRSRLGRRHRFGWLLQAGTIAVAVGFSVRALAGVVWALGIGVEADSTFYWLNLIVYTPLCAGLAVAAMRVAATGVTGRAWPRVTALAVPLALTAGLLYGAYGYAPAEQRDYRSPYLLGDARYADTAVARFHYERVGDGSPVVLLSPGSAWTFAWRKQVAALSTGHTVYVVDLPGQGFTELRDTGFRYDLDAMTGAIESFLDAVGLPSTALGGHSWSGGWALRFAQRHPERVTRLILLAPSGLAERDPLSWEILKLPALGELLTKLGYGSRSSVADATRKLFVHKDLVTEEDIDAMWVPNTFSENQRSVYLLERNLDWRVTQSALGGTRTPTLLLWGNQDTVLPVTQAATFARMMPAISVRLFDDCGHALNLDCPTEVNAAMNGFLA